jgi:predicted HD superfamily hydrolase involved in NAD metabolism
MKLLLAKAWDYARGRLAGERLLHTEGTEEEARRMAALLGADPEKAALAAVLHDTARDLAPQDLLRTAEAKGIIVRTIDSLCPVLLHGRVAAAEAAELGVRDPEVLLAISSHVTGRPGWTSLEKAVYLADKVEKSRSYRGVERVRELVRAGKMEVALREALKNAITYALQSEEGFVDPETVVVFNEVSQGLARAPER